MSNQPPADYIVYKEHDGLSTFYARHKQDLPKPNYPVPAPLWVSDTVTGWTLLRCDCPMCADNYIDQLWDDYYISQ